MLYNVVLVSAVQQHESVIIVCVCIYIYISPLSCSSLHPHPTPLGLHKYRILTHIYGIQKNSTDEPIYREKMEVQM